MALKTLPDPEHLLRLEFHFTAPDDVAKYGERWFRYDETEIIKKSARDLINLEAQIGAPLADVLNGVRADSIFGDTCAAWMALRAAGVDVAFRDFSPAIMLAEWRLVEDEVDAGKASTPETDTSPDAVSPPIVLEHVADSGSADTPSPA